MRLCNRGLNFVQVSDDIGKVRICTWTHDAVVGYLTENSFEEIWNGELANKMRRRLVDGDYSLCIYDDCPYLSRNEIDQHMTEVDTLPEYPTIISLSYDNICNYNCATCDMHERYLATDHTEMEKRFDRIETEVRKVLPHIKEISANGQGEVFASKRILKLLSEWQPLAPANECMASLETNGSLFDEEHWKMIDNLGQYRLTVAVTIMSFDEYTYQQLSGVKYPISRIENNLRFIKSLREKGIIDYLELATVVQERNFRTLPEFTRRCIEEFGADSVRLRYFLPWHKKPAEMEWFTDVRNPYHPYYQEYLEIMKNPIFKHPKVDDWSGGRGSHLGEHPFKKQYDRLKMISQKKLSIMDSYMSDPEAFKKRVLDRIGLPCTENSIAIYGIGEIGRVLVKVIGREHIKEILDRKADCESFDGIDVVKPCDGKYKDEKTLILITPLEDTENIRKSLIEDGIFGRTMDMDEMFSFDSKGMR